MRFTIISTIALLAASATANPIAIEERQSSCAPLVHVNAAGTTEQGLGLVGNAMKQSLPPLVSGATVQALNYNTNAEYFTTAVRAGASTLATLLGSIASRCPNTKFSLSGYSKGALVIHSTTLPSNIQSKVVAVVNFGDPQQRSGSQGIPINNKACFFQYCNAGDQFCNGYGSLGPHLAYARDGSVADSAKKIAACFNASA